MQEDTKQKEKGKEEKKAPPPKPEKKIQKRASLPPEQETKDTEISQAPAPVTLVDAFTQTERIDFQKARYFFYANKFIVELNG